MVLCILSKQWLQSSLKTIEYVANTEANSSIQCLPMDYSQRKFYIYWNNVWGGTDRGTWGEIFDDRMLLCTLSVPDAHH